MVSRLQLFDTLANKRAFSRRMNALQFAKLGVTFGKAFFQKVKRIG